MDIFGIQDGIRIKIHEYGSFGTKHGTFRPALSLIALNGEELALLRSGLLFGGRLGVHGINGYAV